MCNKDKRGHCQRSTRIRRSLLFLLERLVDLLGVVELKLLKTY